MKKGTIIRAKNDNLYEVDVVNEDSVGAFPFGGGFHCTIALSEIAEHPAKMRSTLQLIPLDLADEYVCSGWVDMEDRWNGWLRPMLDEENVKLYLAWQENAASLGCTITARMDEQTIIVADSSYDEDDGEDARVHPHTIETPCGPLRVWSLGYLGWCWSVHTPTLSEGDRCTIICALDTGHKGPCKTADEVLVCEDCGCPDIQTQEMRLVNTGESIDLDHDSYYCPNCSNWDIPTTPLSKYDGPAYEEN